MKLKLGSIVTPGFHVAFNFCRICDLGKIGQYCLLVEGQLTQKVK